MATPDALSVTRSSEAAQDHRTTARATPKQNPTGTATATAQRRLTAADPAAQPELPGTRMKPGTAAYTFDARVRELHVGNPVAKSILQATATFCPQYEGGAVGECWPSRATLVRVTEWGDTAFDTGWAFLRRRGWIRSAGRGTGRRIRVCPEPKPTLANTPRDGVKNTPRDGVQKVQISQRDPETAFTLVVVSLMNKKKKGARSVHAHVRGVREQSATKTARPTDGAPPCFSQSQSPPDTTKSQNRKLTEEDHEFVEACRRRRCERQAAEARQAARTGSAGYETAVDRPTPATPKQPAVSWPTLPPIDPNRASAAQVRNVRKLVKKLRMPGPTEAEARAETRDGADRMIQHLESLERQVSSGRDKPAPPPGTLIRVARSPEPETSEETPIWSTPPRNEQERRDREEILRFTAKAKARNTHDASGAP